MLLSPRMTIIWSGSCWAARSVLRRRAAPGLAAFLMLVVYHVELLVRERQIGFQLIGRQTGRVRGRMAGEIVFELGHSLAQAFHLLVALAQAGSCLIEQHQRHGQAKRNWRRDFSFRGAALEHYLSGERPMSALELAGDLVGCGEGPGDLSTNPKYLQGFGE